MKVLGLTGLSFVIALLWRAEVELRGWAGLIWIGYLHAAIPVGGAMFVLWVRRQMRDHPRKDLIVGWAAIWGCCAWFVLGLTARLFFAGGLDGLHHHMLVPVIKMNILWIAPLVWLCVILALYAGWRWLFVFPSFVWTYGVVLWTGSWLFGAAILHLLPERGSPDLIHVLKTGWLIPFLVVAAGLPVAYRTNKDTSLW